MTNKLFIFSFFFNSLFATEIKIPETVVIVLGYDVENTWKEHHEEYRGFDPFPKKEWQYPKKEDLIYLHPNEKLALYFSDSFDKASLYSTLDHIKKLGARTIVLLSEASSTKDADKLLVYSLGSIDSEFYEDREEKAKPWLSFMQNRHPEISASVSPSMNEYISPIYEEEKEEFALSGIEIYERRSDFFLSFLEFHHLNGLALCFVDDDFDFTNENRLAFLEQAIDVTCEYLD